MKILIHTVEKFEKLKSKLVKQYGAPILFSENSNTEQYVFSSQISVYEALNTANNYKRLMNDQKLIFVDENENVILKKADQILSLLKLILWKV